MAMPMMMSRIPVSPQSPNFGPKTDSTIAPALLGIAGAFLFLNICLLTARAWSRLRPVPTLHWDDWMIFIAGLLCITQFSLLVLCVTHGLGHPTRFVTREDRMTAGRLLFIAQTIWYWSILFIKISVASLLLRIKRSKPWKIFLWSIIVILVLSIAYQTFTQFFQCRPFAVYWDPRLLRGVQCWSKDDINANIIAFSTLSVTTDLIFSLLPLSLISTLHLPRREKIVMCILMCLGLFASAASVMRTIQLQYFYTSRDLFRTNALISLWAVVEQQAGLMAATLPTLKAWFEKCLVRAGLFFYEEKSETRVREALVGMGLIDEKREEGAGWDPVEEEKRKAQARERERRAKDDFDFGLGSVDSGAGEDGWEKKEAEVLGRRHSFAQFQGKRVWVN